MDDELVVCGEGDVDLEHVLIMVFLSEELKGVLGALEGSSAVSDAEEFVPIDQRVKCFVAVVVFLP
jgi:hypothetical protein